MPNEERIEVNPSRPTKFEGIGFDLIPSFFKAFGREVYPELKLKGFLVDQQQKGIVLIR